MRSAADCSISASPRVKRWQWFSQFPSATLSSLSYEVPGSHSGAEKQPGFACSD
jgi:hypothetical protein